MINAYMHDSHSAKMASHSHSLLTLLLLLPTLLSHATTDIPAVFAFGDSILDPGNNNGRPTLFRSDHPPYGRDFPTHLPTGRFSNGRLATDIIVSELGLKPGLPAYLDSTLTDHDLISGVSFASAGNGLDDVTVKQNEVLSIDNQLEMFGECLQRIEKVVGEKQAKNVVGKAAFIIAVGTNDVVNNLYLLPTRRPLTVSGYHDFLLNNFENYLKRMYSMGARRFAVTGLPPVGCLPVTVTIASLSPRGSNQMLPRVCVDQENVDSRDYNTKIQKLLSRLESTLSGSKFGYIDIYNPLIDMVTNPSKYGFEQTLQGCCGTGTIEMGPACNKMASSCQDPSKYMFWDAIHPSETTYNVVATISLRTVFQHLVE